MKTFSKLALIFGLSLFFGCSSTTQIAALKPETDDAAPLVYETTPSFVSIPISINLKDIENQTNKLLTGLIYDDSKIEEDNIEMKIWKLAPISIKNTSGKIRTVLPLKAQIKYRIGTDQLGVSLYTIREFNLNGTITLESEVKLSNWKLNTKTEFKSLNWNESPSTQVMGKSIPITYLINPTVALFKSKIERTIDDAIAQSMDFKPNVLEALEKICTPVQLNEAYDSWLRIVPIELYVTDSKLVKETISLAMGLKCTMETLIGQKPVSKFDKNKVVLKAVTQMPSKISATMMAVSTYQDASKIIAKNFAGQEFSNGKKKITVQNVSVWHKNGKMVIALDLLGSINGTIYLTGYPQYNETRKEIYFDELAYVLDTKSKLLKTANWLAQGIILRKIQENCRYSIQPNLEEGKKSMLAYLKNYSPMPGVVVNGTLDTLDFQKIQLTNKGIIAFIKINGALSVKVDGLK